MHDQGTQSAVMALVLAEHPMQLTLGDLAMEIDGEDSVAQAVRDLIAVGLLRRNGDSLLPTRAALVFDRLSA
jgi:predicted transcriptional regulator